MAPSAVAQTLPYINWVVLVSLALGSFAVVAIGRLATDATRGYLGFTAFCAALLGGLAFLSDGALVGAAGVRVPAPEVDTFRRAALAAFSVLAFVYVFVIRRGGRGPAVAIGALVAGALAAAAGAAGWAADPVGAIAFAVQLLVLAAATGGVLAAMILGHWYLVTPRLSPRPLVLVSRLLTAVVAVQVLLFALWVATGIGTGQGPLSALVGGQALFVWLRLLFGLLFPLVVSWMALKTAQTRSMESATGLLYIDTAAILAGTIVAAGLYFGSGLLV
jgi:hypothetical protein